ncbi:MAG: hypothetical protein Aurels2KO_10680 [Aureliella sp.]
MTNDDNKDYYRFTRPQRADRAMHVLEGLLLGIVSDGEVSDREVSGLISWIGDHMEYAQFHPFNEVIPRLNEILEDGIVDEEEKADILWLCAKFGTDNRFYDAITADMQRLHGMLGGIAADGKVKIEELHELRDWMAAREHLQRCWPYDELTSVLTAVLADGLVDAEEHKVLLAFFSEFVDPPTHKALKLPESEQTLSGVCAIAPEIIFVDRSFCFTGRSDRFTRNELKRLVEDRGGIFKKSVTKDTDYLTIGASGNDCWAYACYGRKVEQAIGNRKAGASTLLVHEFDFHDAVEDS